MSVTSLQSIHRRGHIDAARRLDAQRIHCAHARAMDVDVAGRGQRHLVAADAAAQVLDPTRIQGHQLPTGDGAGVGQRAAHMCIDISPGQQRAAAVQVARMQAQVHVRHQRRRRAAIGQGHRLCHQPHDVAGQLRHLRCGQRHARTQAPGLAHRRAGIQQRLVLRFVAAIPLQEATPGQLPDLLAY